MNIRTNRADPFRLDGRIALITGASGYLGRAIALELAAGGATILLCGARAEKLEPLHLDVKALGGRAVPVPLDTSNARAVRRFFEEFLAAGMHLGILVNTNTAGSSKGWSSTTTQEFLEAAASTIAVPFEITRAAVPLLERGAAAYGQAAVVNIADLAALPGRGPETPPHAGPAQAGLLHLTQYLAGHLASRNIRVNAVLAGFIPTPAAEAANPKLIEDVKRLVPLERAGRPSDVAAAVRFLAGDGAAYTTGATLPVDGGFASR